MSTITIPGPSFKLALYVRRIFTALRYAGLPWVRGSPWGYPWVWVWGGYGDDRPSPQTHGDSMGIFNQPEITR